MEIKLLKNTPYPISDNNDTFARRIWFSSLGAPRGVTLSTLVEFNRENYEKNHRSMVVRIILAIAQAMTEYPKLNYYTFWGKLVWAGEKPKISVIMENSDYSCDIVLLDDPLSYNGEEIRKKLLNRDRRTEGAKSRNWLKRKFPLLYFLFERISGRYVKEYTAKHSPVFLSIINLPGIQEISYTPAHSMSIYPGWLENGKMKLTICYNHQLANARPVGRFLLRIREILESQVS